MKKTMLIAVGALALGTLAQTSSVPQPVNSANGTAAQSSTVPPSVSTSPVAVQEFEPGALCRVYNVTSRGRSTIYNDANANRRVSLENMKKIQEQLSSGAVAVDQGYDATSLDFDGRKINKHGGNLIIWDGVFMAKRAGLYAIMLSAPCVRGGAQVVLNGGGIVAIPNVTETCEVELAKGPNTIQVLVYGGETPTLEYRLRGSTRPAKKITPAMLSHVAEDEEEW